MPNSLTPPIVISGSAVWTPPYQLSNAELVESYNAYAALYNTEHAQAIAAGRMAPKYPSSERFIEKASGIKSRFVYTKKGILDIHRMRPQFAERRENEISNQAEIGIHAARMAMQSAGKTSADIDAVIIACAYTQRAYPAIAIEIQDALGIEGFAFDMLGACSAATFGLHRAYDSLRSGSARCVLAINPELVTPQVNYCDRDTHFIFGDVSTAVIMERIETCRAPIRFEILNTSALTRFSSNIRSNFGHMSRATDADPYGWDKLFHQAGRKVFDEVSPIAAGHIKNQLALCNLQPSEVKRFWLHQANINMNRQVLKHLLDDPINLEMQSNPANGSAPIILDRYANTASAGSIIAFHHYHADFSPGDVGVICSFGAGYSVGSLVLRRL